MKLSVVIPAFNAADTLGEQLEALSRQQWSHPWEVIVADNGSTDGTKGVVEKYKGVVPNLRLVDASQRPGPSYARNMGVKAARGEFVLFCDADDVIGEGWVAAMGDALTTHSFVACRVDMRKLNPPWTPGLDDHPQVRGLEQAPYPPYLLNAGAGTLGVHKSLYESVGGFDEYFLGLQDHDLCYRLARAGARLHWVKDAVLHVRTRSTTRGMFKQAFEWGKWNVAIYKRHCVPGRSHLWCWRFYARDCVRHLLRLAKIRTRQSAIGWIWGAGLFAGLLWGSIRFWGPPAPFLSFTYVEGSDANEYEPGTIPRAPAHGYLMRALRKPVLAVTRRCLGTISHVKTTESLAALTFDDGPDPEVTPRLLEILRRHDARATFFMLGECAQAHADIVRRVAEDGHVIGNHSWDHPSFPKTSSSARREQIHNCAKVTAPHGQRLFRPPYGEQNLGSRLDAWRLGYRVITWSVDVWDWCEKDARRMADAVEKQIRPGSIVLFHDHVFRRSHAPNAAVADRQTNRDRTAMLAAVEMLLERLGQRFRFVTIPELLASGSPVKRNWFVTEPSDWERLNARG